MSSWNDAVIVVGGGLSGGSCVLTLLELGKRVILVEKEKKLGGNSVRASSGYNGSETMHQKEQNIPDTNDLFAHDTSFSATKNIKAKVSPLIKTLVDNSADGISWLEKKGIHLPVLSQCGGHSAARTHRPTSGAAGGYITLGLLRKVKKYTKGNDPKCKIIKQAKLVKVLTSAYNKNKVTGIEYINLVNNEKVKLYGSAVVVATGGFCYNREMIIRYRPNEANTSTTNGHWAQGEGMMCCEAIGAKLVDMEHIQVHPTGFINESEPNAREKVLAAECLRASGALLINEKGYRFTNELGHRDDVTSAEKIQKGKIRLILNPVAVSAVAPHVRMYYKFFKVLKLYKNAQELADSMNIPVANLIDTFETYNNSAKKGWCPSGKPRFPGAPYLPNQELYCGFVEPVLHYVMGGVAINNKAEVLNQNNQIISGLYACGENAGGIHGVNRLAGNSLVDCVVYGRVAGNSAAKYVNSQLSKL